MTQLCLWFQWREAGRGRRAGCSGLGPGHTLCHAAQEKPLLERDRGLGCVCVCGGDPKSRPPQGTSTGPRGHIVPPAQPLDTSGPLSLVRTRSTWQRAVAVATNVSGV